jgi:hypothetical protein
MMTDGKADVVASDGAGERYQHHENEPKMSLRCKISGD